MSQGKEGPTLSWNHLIGVVPDLRDEENINLGPGLGVEKDKV